MKKFFLIIIIVLLLLIVSAFLENSYCHVYTTVNSEGSAPAQFSFFCKANSFFAIPYEILLAVGK